MSDEGAIQRVEERPKLKDLPKEDNWEHRSEGMKCFSCMWYVPKADTPRGGIERGRCRKRAPTMNGYPVVFVTDWCGDHKLR